MVDYTLQEGHFKIIKDMIEILTNHHGYTSTDLIGNLDIVSNCDEEESYNNTIKPWWEDWESFGIFFSIYFNKLQDSFVSLLETQLFNNEDEIVYHCTFLNNLENIFKDKLLKSRKHHSREESTIKWNLYNFDKTFFANHMGNCFIQNCKNLNEAKFNGVCFIVPKLNDYKIFKRVYYIDEDLEQKIIDVDNEFFNVNKYELWFKTETYIQGDIPLNDIKRIYILSPDMELVRIYNNIGGEKFEIIDTEFVNDILKGKELDLRSLVFKK